MSGSGGARSEAELRERCASLEDDVAAYRALAARALALVRDLTQPQDDLRRTRAKMRADVLAARWAAHEAAGRGRREG